MDIGPVIWSIAPTVVVGLIFWFIMWSVIRADRHERDATTKLDAQMEAEERARAGLPPAA